MEDERPRGVDAAVSKWREHSRQRNRFDLCISDGVRDMVGSHIWKARRKVSVGVVGMDQG
jgi:hypothetical protein